MPAPHMIPRQIGENAAPPPVNKKPRLGINLGNISTTAEVTRFEDWLSGKQVELVQLFAGNASWADLQGSIGFVAGLYDGVQRCERIFSIGMFPVGGSYANAISGAYDPEWKIAAQNTLLACRPVRGQILVRLAWEFNGPSFFPWDATANVANFITAWRRCVTVFKSVSRRFKFVWCPTFVDSANLTQYWPGDAYVDVVSVDTYVYLASFTGNPAGAINYYLNTAQGASFPKVKELADAHGKPMSIDEWCAGENNYGPYITAVADFIRNNNVIYHAWWEMIDAYDGFMNDESYPTTGTVFQQRFGNWTPRNLTGLVRFFDAKQDFRATANAAAVTAWNDMSTQNSDGAQGTATNQPTKQTRNGHEEIRFDGSNDFITCNGNALNFGTGPSFIFIVANNTAAGDNFFTCLSIGQQADGQCRQIGTNFSRLINVECYGTGNGHTVASPTWVSTDRMIAWRLDPAATASESILNIDGGADDTANFTGTAINTPGATCYIGSRSGPGIYWQGGIQCIVILNAIPSTSDRQKLEGWAAWRYGLQARLDSAHPYKTNPPLN